MPAGLNVRILGLSSWDYYDGFQVVTPLANIQYFGASAVGDQPDIYIEDDGGVIWFTTKDNLLSSSNIQVHMLDTATGVLKSHRLPFVAVSSTAVTAPRIAAAPGGGVLVFFGVHSVSLNVMRMWRTREVAGVLQSVQITGLDDALTAVTNVPGTARTRQIIGPYDFDCRGANCAMGFAPIDLENAASGISAVQRRYFTVPTGGNALTYNSPWLRDPNLEATGVAGITLTPNGYTYLSVGTVGTTKFNTRTHQYFGTTAASTTAAVSVAGDAITCLTSATPNGLTMRPATSDGGASIAFCQDCFGGGSLEEVRMTTTEAGPTNACY
jgi:hypothetical protein